MPILPDAHDFTVSNSNFIDQSISVKVDRSSHTQTINQNQSKGQGLRTLLKASIPEASHDSSARYPPPKCHPGTRKEYIQRLTQWGQNADNHPDRIAWLKGPAGVGKSAIAQSCAEALGDKLGAAFFFSRPNNRDDPDCFFTSISYQLAVRFDPYGELLDNEIQRDPTLVKKSLPHQFHNLLVTPFRALRRKGKEFTERVIIVDGLDECASTEAQVNIVKIVAESARTRSTPFLWIFLSRLEPHLVATFDSPEVKGLSLPIELHITREIDGEILLYLTDKLAETARKHELALPWPSEKEVWVLVDLVDGLFVYAYTLARFIDEEDSAGPMDQLHAVLRLAERTAMNGPNHPLSGLNGFYTLIVERVPPRKLQTVQWILLATRLPRISNAVLSANLLGLSESQFRSACRSLHSVLKVTSGTLSTPPNIVFYHASFMDFLEDPARSKGLCIWSDCAVALWDDILHRLDHIRISRDPNSDYAPDLVPTWLISKSYPLVRTRYSDLVRAFFNLFESVNFEDDPQRLNALINFDFKKVCLYESGLAPDIHLQTLLQKIPPQTGLIRPSIVKSLLQYARIALRKSPGLPIYVIGNGAKKALLEADDDGRLYVVPYSKRRVRKFMEKLYKESHTETSSS